MPVFTALMLVIVVSSITLCLITLGRVFAYNKKYHLPETKYTKLFRIFTKEHIAMIYLSTVIAHFIFTVWFIYTL